MVAIKEISTQSYSILNPLSAFSASPDLAMTLDVAALTIFLVCTVLSRKERLEHSDASAFIAVGQRNILQVLKPFAQRNGFKTFRQLVNKVCVKLSKRFLRKPI